MRAAALLGNPRPMRKGSRRSSYLDSDCLFPKEQGATGMNSSVLTASLTGRIQFFCDVALRRTVTAHLRQLTRCASIPPLVQLRPRGRAALACGPVSRSERGYEPRARERPSLRRGLRHASSGGSEGRVPMEVPDPHATLPNSRDPDPPPGSPATSGLRAAAAHNPYPRL